MSTLFREAIADAKQLRQAAEQNAREAVIAAMTPKIRDLVERQLLSESSEGDDILLSGESEPTGVTPRPSQVPGTTAASAGTTAEISLPDAEGKVTLNVDDIKTPQPQVAIGFGGGDMPPTGPGSALPAGSAEVMLDDEAIDVLKGLGETARSGVASVLLEAEADIIELRLRSLAEDPRGVRARAAQIRAVAEAAFLHAKATQGMRQSTLRRLSERLEEVVAECDDIAVETRIAESSAAIRTIAGKVRAARGTVGRPMTEAARRQVGRFIVGIEADISEASRIVEHLGAARTDRRPAILQAGRDLLDMYKETRGMSMRNGTRLLNEEDIMLRLSLPEDSEIDPTDLGIEIVGDEGSEAEEGSEDVDVDIDDESGADDDFNFDDLGAGDGDADEDDEPVEEAASDVYEGQHNNDKGAGDDALDENEVVEISEAMLRNEILRMKRIAEARKKAKAGKAKDKKKDVKEGVKVGKPESTGTGGPGRFEDFGGGSDEGHPFIDNTYSEIKKESVRNRALIRKLGEYRSAYKKAVSKLSEVNLLNAKLIYANRLFMNPSMTPRLRESIIDNLDAAKNLHEVKLVYNSMTRSSKQAPGQRQGITESRTRGSASRPSRSGAATLNEATEVSRWQLLAGINGSE